MGNAVPAPQSVDEGTVGIISTVGGGRKTEIDVMNLPRVADDVSIIRGASTLSRDQKAMALVLDKPSTFKASSGVEKAAAERRSEDAGHLRGIGCNFVLDIFLKMRQDVFRSMMVPFVRTSTTFFKRHALLARTGSSSVHVFNPKDCATCHRCPIVLKRNRAPLRANMTEMVVQRYMGVGTALPKPLALVTTSERADSIIVMQRLTGQTLHSFLANLTRRVRVDASGEKRKEALYTVREIFTSAGKQLTYCHMQGVAHCDVHLCNLFVMHEGKMPRILLIDYGRAVPIGLPPGPPELYTQFTAWYRRTRPLRMMDYAILMSWMIPISGDTDWTRDVRRAAWDGLRNSVDVFDCRVLAPLINMMLQQQAAGNRLILPTTFAKFRKGTRKIISTELLSPETQALFHTVWLTQCARVALKREDLEQLFERKNIPQDSALPLGALWELKPLSADPMRVFYKQWARVFDECMGAMQRKYSMRWVEQRGEGDAVAGEAAMAFDVGRMVNRVSAMVDTVEDAADQVGSIADTVGTVANQTRELLHHVAPDGTHLRVRQNAWEEQRGDTWHPVKHEPDILEGAWATAA